MTARRQKALWLLSIACMSLIALASLSPTGVDEKQTSPVTLPTAAEWNPDETQVEQLGQTIPTPQPGVEDESDTYVYGALSSGEEMELLGQKVRLRELLSKNGDLVNLEFVIRRGIRPRRLFESGNQKILSYEELHYNNVGYGAGTVWLLYQLQSTNGVDVAVSRPDGSDYRVLASGLEKILDYEHFPSENRVRLDLVEGGSRVSRDYLIGPG